MWRTPSARVGVVAPQPPPPPVFLRNSAYLFGNSEVGFLESAKERIRRAEEWELRKGSQARMQCEGHSACYHERYVESRSVYLLVIRNAAFEMWEDQKKSAVTLRFEWTVPTLLKKNSINSSAETVTETSISEIWGGVAASVGTVRKLLCGTNGKLRLSASKSAVLPELFCPIITLKPGRKTSSGASKKLL